MPILPAYVLAFAALLVVPLPASAAERRIAVHNFTGEPEGALSPLVLDALADEARRAAVDTLPKREWLVLTREAQETILREQDVDPTKLCEAECEIDLARVIGAHLLVTGKVVKLGGSFRMTMKLFDSERASVLKIVSEKAKNPVDFVDRMHAISTTMFKEAVPKDDKNAKLCAELVRAFSPGDPDPEFDYPPAAVLKFEESKDADGEYSLDALLDFDDSKVRKPTWAQRQLAAIHPDHALPACEAAVLAEPRDVFLLTQFGRALAKAGRSEEAVRWYHKAADLGYAPAQANLAFMYENGLGVARNDAEAMRWYLKAAEQGDADAQSSIGAMTASGRGVAWSDAEALRWWRKAAAQGQADARENLRWEYSKLGRKYRYGWGVVQDDAEAVRWYTKAAEQEVNDPEVYAYLGFMHYLGRGVPRNDAEAVRWYRKAADLGAEPNMDQVNEIVKLNIGSLRPCVEAAAKNGHKLPGKSKLLLLIRQNGTVGAGKLMDANINATPLGKCVVKAAKKWGFPPQGGEFELEVPLILSTG